MVLSDPVQKYGQTDAWTRPNGRAALPWRTGHAKELGTWKPTAARRPGKSTMIRKAMRTVVLLASLISIIVAGGAAIRPF